MPRGRKASPFPDRFWKQVKKTGPDDCWLWKAGTTKDGYGRLLGPDKKKRVLAHRAAWELANGPTEYFVLHKCDVPACVNPTHLFIGTQLDNIADMDAKRRRREYARGSENLQAKLSDEKIRLIHSEPKAAGYQTRLAQLLGVNQTTISRIIRGQTWRHKMPNLKGVP